MTQYPKPQPRPERVWTIWQVIAALAAVALLVSGWLVSGGTERGDLKARVTRNEQDINEVKARQDRFENGLAKQLEDMRLQLRTLITEQRMLHGKAASGIEGEKR